MYNHTLRKTSILKVIENRRFQAIRGSLHRENKNCIYFLLFYLTIWLELYNKKQNSFLKIYIMIKFKPSCLVKISESYTQVYIEISSKEPRSLYTSLVVKNWAPAYV